MNRYHKDYMQLIREGHSEECRAKRLDKLEIIGGFVSASLLIGTMALFGHTLSHTLLKEADTMTAPTVAYQEPAPLEEPVYASRKDRIEKMIREQAKIYGLDPDQAVMIAQCESGLNERAKNANSTASGVYQFTDGTWEYIKAEGHQYDAEENIKQFMIWYEVHPEWWECE